MRTRSLWMMAATLLVPGTAGAELVYFAAGGGVQLPARVAGEVVELETPAGRLGFPRAEIREVVPGHDPGSAWEARRVEALAEGAEARFAAAWWALENGLTPEAVAMLRRAHEADPAHGAAARMVTALDRLAAPWPAPDLARLRRDLPLPLRTARGPHVVLLHDHDAAEALDRVEVLERVVTTYYLVLAAQGFDLPPPPERLASAWFPTRAGYQAALRACGAEAFAANDGYFHPSSGLVLACDLRDSARARAAREALRAARARLGRDGRGEADRLRRDLDRRELLADLDRRARDLGTAAHETVHQLVQASGLAPRRDTFPTWLHEGLAAQFEVVRGGRWAGVGRANDLRLPDWRALRPGPALEPLLADTGLGGGYRAGAYAQSWALVYYLRKRHPQEFTTFLDLLRTPGDAPAPDRHRAAFRAAFGDDPGAIERDWIRFLAETTTPLEDHAPAPGGP